MEEKKELTHKGLLYWHRKAMGRIPVSKDEWLVLYPGYNSFNYSDIEYIYRQCKDHFDRGVLTFYGISVRDGKFIETGDLAKITVKELDKILDNTYNPETLDDLSNPSIVNALYVKQAAARKEKLAEAKGVEADSIDEVKENKDTL